MSVDQVNPTNNSIEISGVPAEALPLLRTLILAQSGVREESPTIQIKSDRAAMYVAGPHIERRGHGAVGQIAASVLIASMVIASLTAAVAVNLIEFLRDFMAKAAKQDRDVKFGLKLNGVEVSIESLARKPEPKRDE